MVDLPDNFANHPISIAEARANRDPGGASTWTARDALIAALRDLDKGLIKPVALGIAICCDDSEGGPAYCYYNASTSTLEVSGLYLKAALTMIDDDEGDDE